MINDKIHEIVEKMNSIKDFSGAVIIKENDKVVLKNAFGFADISNKIKNAENTRFGIASGAKILTSISICKLVDQGKLSFDTLLKDCLDIKFPFFDSKVTIHHLLTHCSGIPDYFDEETLVDFSELWVNIPMYLLRNPKSFIPMIQNQKMKFNPGEKFSYNNGAFIVLGLVIEQITGMNFVDFVRKNIFDVLEMSDSGYFAFDMLPENCAYGYIKNTDGTLKTNIYSLPIVGGPDGGVYMTVEDMSKLWHGLFNNKLLSKEITNKFLTPHIHVEKNVYYGYGLWITKKEDELFKYFVMGSDPGVRFRSSFYPKSQIEITAVSNKEFGPYDISTFVESLI
ncbi:MAG: penicillin-binding protein [Haloplasmataceae bacterium]|jgi:CubicO group peptidase (beta-lactamase class C family)|nr:penicillin-binding protein [Haloplasmataceae bacterium]